MCSQRIVLQMHNRFREGRDNSTLTQQSDPVRRRAALPTAASRLITIPLGAISSLFLLTIHTIFLAAFSFYTTFVGNHQALLRAKEAYPRIISRRMRRQRLKGLSANHFSPYAPPEAKSLPATKRL
jgi:hypothetical protein